MCVSTGELFNKRHAVHFNGRMGLSVVLLGDALGSKLSPKSVKIDKFSFGKMIIEKAIFVKMLGVRFG